MLGYNRNTEPASPAASKEIRAAIHRIATGNLDEKDREILRRQKEVESLYTAEWK